MLGLLIMEGRYPRILAYPAANAAQQPQCPKHAAAQAEPIEGEQRANLPQNVPGLFGIIPNIPPKPQIYHHAGGKFRRSDEGCCQRRLEHNAPVRKAARNHTQCAQAKARPARPLSSGCGRARQSPARCSLRHPQKIVQLFASCIFHPPFSATRGARLPPCVHSNLCCYLACARLRKICAHIEKSRRVGYNKP